MSPIQQRRRDSRSVAFGVGGLVIGLVLLLVIFFFAIPKLTEQGTVKVNVGTRTLALGHAEVKAAAIGRDGPLLFSDPASGQLDIYVQHLGDDRDKGWTAFAARRPGTSRDCTLKWDNERRLFADPCDGTTVPADGDALPHYKVDIDADEQLTLNLEALSAGSTPGTTP